VFTSTPHQWATASADSRRRALTKSPQRTYPSPNPPRAGRPLGQGMGPSLHRTTCASPCRAHRSTPPGRQRGG
jgi:hypothetical protein